MNYVTQQCMSCVARKHFVQYGVAKNDLFNDLHDMMYTLNSFDHNKLYALPYFKSNSYKYYSELSH